MRENQIVDINSKGEKEIHILLEPENSDEASTMCSSEFVNALTNDCHCIDFSLSIGKQDMDSVFLEVKKITYDEQIADIKKLVVDLVEKKIQNKPKIDITAL